jgi:ABC-type phosphate transport system substrate-binding protein
MLYELLLVVVMGVTAADVRPPLAELPFHVIVNESNPIATITRAELSAIYLKRTRSWSGGKAIAPVGQPAKSRLREQFSRHIHGKSVAYVTRYWQRLIFSGRGIPPAEVANSAAVLEFVRKNAGAVGYVERDTILGGGVKVMAVTR